MDFLQARSLQQNKLELRFRPEDPYSHPAFGELYHCNSFLLKISKNGVGETSSAVDMEKTSKSVLADSNNQDPKISFPESLETEHIDQIRSESVSASATVKQQASEEVQENLCADIVAQVTESYHFNG